MGACNLIINEFILSVIYANLQILENLKMNKNFSNKISGGIKKNNFNVIGNIYKIY